jgi:hypothetical protein
MLKYFQTNSFHAHASFYLEQCEMMQEMKKKPIKEFKRWKTKRERKTFLLTKYHS